MSDKPQEWTEVDGDYKFSDGEAAFIASVRNGVTGDDKVEWYLEQGYTYERVYVLKEAEYLALRAQLAEAQLAAASDGWEDVPIHEIWHPNHIPPGHWEVRAQRRNVNASAGDKE